MLRIPWRCYFNRIHDLVQRSSGSPSRATYWNKIFVNLNRRGYYLDEFLGQLKKHAYLSLIERWGGVSETGRILKTDLFEEVIGSYALITDLSVGRNQVIGVDISSMMTSSAKERDTGQCARYVIADVRFLPFKNGTFAFILSPSTLDHFTDPSDLCQSLKELKRILQPGGRLIVTLDNRENLFDPLFRIANDLGWLPFSIGHSYRKRELHSVLESVGLKVIETTAILHNPRFLAVGAVTVANKLRFQPLITLVQSLLIAAQRMEGTRWQYRTGSFIAALAVRTEGINGKRVE